MKFRGAAVLLGALALVSAQGPAADKVGPDPRIAGFEKHQAMKRTSPFKDLEWSYLGPTNVGGGAVDVAVADRGASRRIYVAYIAGGVAKSDDNGDTWQPVLTEAAEPFANVVAVAPSNPDVVWVATAAGAYKSVDAARTWTYVGLSSAQGCRSGPGRCFGRIVIHPTNPNIVYVAAAGPGALESALRGVFKTTDGGRTWTKVLFRNTLTGAMDLAMDPKDPETLYAALWQQTHAQSGFFYAGIDRDANQTSIWKTTNGGGTWTEAAAGLPLPRYRGRIGIDISRSNPSVLYAFINSYEPRVPVLRLTGSAVTQSAPQESFNGPELYRSADGGSNWERVSRADMIENVFFLDQFGQVRVDPKHDDTVYLLSVQLSVSHNGGATFVVVPGTHVDHKGLWIDPKRDVLYDCNDGGIYLSDNAGATWKFRPAPSTLMYGVALDMARPFHAYGSVQDYSSFRVTVDVSKGRSHFQPMEFDLAPGFEYARHAIDPTDANILFADVNGFNRYDLSASPPRATAIAPGIPVGDPPARSALLKTFIMSRHDPKTIYWANQRVYRSRDRGDHWDRISADLTDDNEDARYRPPFFRQAITVLAESPTTRGLVYAGTDDGHLHVTTNDGSAWTELTGNLPWRKPVTDILASRAGPGVMYVVAGLGHKYLPVIVNLNDFGAYVVKSTDYGRTFISVDQGIPVGPVTAIREDPRDPTILYACTRLGVYVSTDGGIRWEVLGGNLPTVYVTDLQIHPRDNIIVVSTFGHGMWAMDAMPIIDPVRRRK